MRSVMFNFRSSVSRQGQDALLARLGEAESIISAGRVRPNARTPEASRMGYAYVEDGVDLDALITRLSELPEVESAFVPAERRLISPVTGG